mmetsp:Transcript_34871/g.76082  ORF Transcript_34871/g.76082 Transcript_34871/m.76082 type:complete len:266 (+) Transcript_34871:174-971(+)
MWRCWWRGAGRMLLNGAKVMTIGSSTSHFTWAMSPSTPCRTPENHSPSNSTSTWSPRTIPKTCWVWPACFVSTATAWLPSCLEARSTQNADQLVLSDRVSADCPVAPKPLTGTSQARASISKCLTSSRCSTPAPGSAMAAAPNGPDKVHRSAALKLIASSRTTREPRPAILHCNVPSRTAKVLTSPSSSAKVICCECATLVATLVAAEKKLSGSKGAPLADLGFRSGHAATTTAWDILRWTRKIAGCASPSDDTSAPSNSQSSVS